MTIERFLRLIGCVAFMVTHELFDFQLLLHVELRLAPRLPFLSPVVPGNRSHIVSLCHCEHAVGDVHVTPGY